MKTAISLPDQLFMAAESLAESMGISRSRLYATALEDYIARHHAYPVKERLDAVYSTESSEMDPAIKTAQKHALKSSDW